MKLLCRQISTTTLNITSLNIIWIALFANNPKDLIKGLYEDIHAYHSSTDVPIVVRKLFVDSINFSCRIILQGPGTKFLGINKNDSLTGANTQKIISLDFPILFSLLTFLLWKKDFHNFPSNFVTV